jgi:uncharacterized membrane protein YgcG
MIRLRHITKHINVHCKYWYNNEIQKINIIGHGVRYFKEEEEEEEEQEARGEGGGGGVRVGGRGGGGGGGEG